MTVTNRGRRGRQRTSTAVSGHCEVNANRLIHKLHPAGSLAHSLTRTLPPCQIQLGNEGSSNSVLLLLFREEVADVAWSTSLRPPESCLLLVTMSTTKTVMRTSHADNRSMGRVACVSLVAESPACAYNAREGGHERKQACQPGWNA